MLRHAVSDSKFICITILLVGLFKNVRRRPSAASWITSVRSYSIVKTKTQTTLRAWRGNIDMLKLVAKLDCECDSKGGVKRYSGYV